MAWVTLDHSSTVTIPAPGSDVVALLRTPEHWGRLQPHVVRVTRRSDDVVEWEFESMVVAGLRLRPGYQTRMVEVTPFQLRWEPVDPERFHCAGNWTVTPVGPSRAEVRVDVAFSADIAIPAALVSLARPAAQREFARMIDQLLANLVHRFASPVERR